MARAKKDCVKVTYTLERELAEALERFCDETGRTKTKVVEMAISEFIKKYDKDDEK